MTAGRSVNSNSRDWCTPQHYVDAVRSVFRGEITLDPCSNRYSIVNAEVEYMLPDQDGLVESWDAASIYVNPPYGADRERGTTIADWLRRCAEAHADFRSEVLALVPVATNTGHWKRSVWGRATGVAFLADTRLKFLVRGKPSAKGAPMSCAMIYWGRAYSRFLRVFGKLGAVVDVRPLQGADR